MKAEAHTSTVKGNDLVAEDVAAGLDVLGDVDGGGKVVGDHLVGLPVARDGVIVDQTDGSGLEEAEVAGLDGCAVSWAGGEVIDDWSVVRVGPGVPLEVDGAACLDGDKGFAGRGALVARDVLFAVLGWGDEAVVLVQCHPACRL